MIVKRKLFSFIDEEGNLGYYLYNEATGEEKLFSVVEEEREFALSDYKGLTDAGKKILKQRRNDYAKQLYTAYRKDMKDISNVSKNTPNIIRLSTRGNIVAGGVRTNYGANTTRGLGSVGNFTNLHKKTVRKQLLKGAKDASNIMRDEVLATHRI